MDQTKIGLALSGGGIKASAHVGALKFFEEIGVKPTVFSGSSAGALVGAFAAAKYTPSDMLDFFKATTIFKPSNFAWRKPAWIDSNKFEGTLREFFPDDRFEALSHPLYVTVTDITNGFSKVFSEGQLVKILMATSAYPVVFSPIEINDILYADGAILNNFPVEPLIGNCDKIIGINAHRRKVIKNSEMTSSYKIFRRAYEISTHYSYFKKYKDCDVVIAPDNLEKYSTLRNNHAQEIFEIGYETAKEQRENLLHLI